MPGVIFDPFAEADLVKQFEIETGSLLDPLRLDQFLVAGEKVDPLAQLALDCFDGAQHGIPRRHVMRGRKDRKAQRLVHQVPGQRIEELQAFHLVIEQGHPDGVLGMFGRENIDDVTAHTEGTAMKIHLVALVLHLGQPLDDGALVESVADAHGQDHVVIFVAIADTVDARHRGDDDHVAALDQAFGRRQPHLLDVIIDRTILFNEQIA